MIIDFQSNRPQVKSFTVKSAPNQHLHFAINISGNSPFGTPALTKNAKRYEW